MNLVEELSKPRTKVHAQSVADFIVKNPAHVKDLMKVYFDENHRLTQNAAYFVMYVSDYNPSLIKPYLGQLIENLETNPSVAIRRNSVRILQNQQIPEKYEGVLYNQCFNYLISSQEPIAVKAFSMTVLANIAQKYPELAQELKPIVQDAIALGSPGIISRGKKILSQLNKIL